MGLAFTFAAYGLGALMGLAVDRGGPRLQRDWPIYLRAQLVATSILIGLFSAWRLTSAGQIVAPVLVACSEWVLLGTSWATRRDNSAGFSILEAWGAFPNSTFWVFPMAGAFGGPVGSMIAALSNAAYTVPSAVGIHLLRRDAPVRQRRSTTWFDQSALLAVVVGLFLHLAGPAPASSHWVLAVAGPVLAFVGAALVMGSVLHPHNRSTGTSPNGVRRWIFLAAVRVAYFLPIAVFSHAHALTVIALLSAFTPPAFNPSQLAVLYGYRCEVVNAAVRWGWILVPVGIALVALT